MLGTHKAVVATAKAAPHFDVRYRQNTLYCYLIHMSPNTQFLTDPEGHKTAVVVPLSEYESLLEDLHDLALIAERKDEPRVSLEDVKSRLKADGLLQD